MPPKAKYSEDIFAPEPYEDWGTWRASTLARANAKVDALR
jgi:hypothetical protein